MAVLTRVPRSREVKRPNQRWGRQRSITRGHLDDHGAEGAAPVITGITPSTKVVGAGNSSLTINGNNFPDDGPVVYYTAPGQAETGTAGTWFSPTVINAPFPASAFDTVGTITWYVIFGGGAGPTVPGTPNISVTAS